VKKEGLKKNGRMEIRGKKGIRGMREAREQMKIDSK
jgi:hypothetical protein